ncbi:MAG TPA: hypothetical protein VK986_05025, partial [Tepidisphaeraceae bacterium]|nr:hypothetical protein [Tepidisphaeraceae bacterium]
ELTALLAALPASKSPPPLARLVIVSRQVGDEWRTDVYDAAELPPAMEAVMAILGERYETRGRRPARSPADSLEARPSGRG